MRTAFRILTTALALGMAQQGCTTRNDTPPPAATSPLAAKIDRFAPTVLTADTSTLSPGDRAALPHLIAAAAVMDRLYLRQAWDGNEETLARLKADPSPEGKERLRYFLINMGPWSRLDDHAAFLEGVPQRHPPGANYYPADMTREEFTAWMTALPEKAQKDAMGYFTTIRRRPDRSLTAVPYSREYRPLLEEAAGHLRAAAAATDNPSLARYLSLRADAFFTDDYYASDVAWMELDSPLDVTVGPYEVYRDELFNYKAAFEAFITRRNDEETGKLALFSSHLQEIEDNLPIAASYRNPKIGALAPIRVVDLIVTGGEARAGVQTAAFNLPNDERVVARMGSKRVMLKNVQEAKFNKVLTPIAAKVIAPSQQGLVAFEPFFTHILAHELVHGLGPHSITVDGRKTTVRQSMKELGSAFEEAKGDIAGLFALRHLMDRGVIDNSMIPTMYVTYLAGIFRSVRFGINEAHGRGMALQFNYLLDRGAILHDAASGRYSVDLGTMPAAVKELTAEIMTIQAEGSYDRAKAMLDTYAVIRPHMQQALDRLSGIPVDIAPDYPLAAR